MQFGAPNSAVGLEQSVRCNIGVNYKQNPLRHNSSPFWIEMVAHLLQGKDSNVPACLSKTEA